MASYILARLRRVGSGLFVSNSPGSTVMDSSLPPGNEDVTRSPAPQEHAVISSPSQNEAMDRSMSPQKEAVSRPPSPQEAIVNTPSCQEKAIAKSPSREEEAVARSLSPQEESEDLFVSQEEAMAKSPSPRQEAITRTSSAHEQAVASPSPVPATSGLTQAEFEDSQRASKVRLPWDWRVNGKTTEEYTPQIKGKWWSKTPEELSSAHPNKRRDYGHIGRIMETELGEQLFDKQRCITCQTNDEECWIYSARGSQQVSRPGDACARCRYTARKGGCSLAKRRSNKRRRSSPDPAPRVYRPLRPGGEPQFT